MKNKLILHLHVHNLLKKQGTSLGCIHSAYTSRP